MKGAAEPRCRQLDGRAAILRSSEDLEECVALPRGSSIRRMSVHSDDSTPFPPPFPDTRSPASDRLARAVAIAAAPASILPWPFWVAEDEMRVNIGIVVLAAWLLGVIGVDSVGDRVHLPLLVGLMLLRWPWVKARGAAVVRHHDSDRKQ
jgi:hypothetical protein